MTAIPRSLSEAETEKLVTQHATFIGPALDYGLNQVSYLRFVTSEPSAISLECSWQEYIKKNDIIYFEENASKSLSENLDNETGVDPSCFGVH